VTDPGVIRGERDPQKPPAEPRLVPIGTPAPGVAITRDDTPPPLRLRAKRWWTNRGLLGFRRSGFTVDTRWGRFLLTAVAEGEYGPGPRKLYLLRDDFRSVIFKLPWSRKLWPRRNLGR
jgi:hypothetical protein